MNLNWLKFESFFRYYEVPTELILKRRNLHRSLLLDCCNNKQIFEVNWSLKVKSLNVGTCIVVFYKSVQIDRFCPADVILRSWSTIWRRSGTPHVGSAKPNKIRRNWKLAQVSKCLFINLFWFSEHFFDYRFTLVNAGLAYFIGSHALSQHSGT